MTTPDITDENRVSRGLAQTIATNKRKRRNAHRSDAALQVVDLQAELVRRREVGLLGVSLAELLRDPSLLVEPVECVPLLAVEGGVTLLSGREKSGKSTLAGHLCSQLTQGEPSDRALILGSDVALAVTIGWYAMDERMADAVRRFAAMGANPARVWINDTPRTVEDLKTALQYDLAARPETKVIVVDTLSRVLAGSGVDTNDAGPVERALGGLVQLLHDKGVTALLLYHTGKAGHTYRGSTAIGAVVDDIATLRLRNAASGEDERTEDEEEGDDGRRQLVLEGRYLRGRHQLVADARSGLYSLYDPSFASTSRVLNALSRGPARSKTELAKWAGGRRQDRWGEIGSLIARGQIEEHPNGSLALPTRSHNGAGMHPGTPSGTHSQAVPSPFPPYGNTAEQVAPVPVAHTLGVQYREQVHFDRPDEIEVRL